MRICSCKIALIHGDRISTEFHLKNLVLISPMHIMFLHFMVELWLRNLECVIEDEIQFHILVYFFFFNFKVKA